MNKFMNILFLTVWIYQLVIGIMAACGKATINPIIFICAVLICIFNYLEELDK